MGGLGGEGMNMGRYGRMKEGWGEFEVMLVQSGGSKVLSRIVGFAGGSEAAKKLATN